MTDNRVTVTFCLNRLLVFAGIPLMSSTDLMVTKCIRVRNLLKLGATNEVLRVNQRVTNKTVAADHSHEFILQHSIPLFACYQSIVNLVNLSSILSAAFTYMATHNQRGCKDFAKSWPVLINQSQHRRVDLLLMKEGPPLHRNCRPTQR
jgi:hypothetical protein